ncbi:YjgF-like protein [Polyplosphaeria fusca]|uniref:YjgF-like protein n=1 Tax=Polyplosphaeria fusca TaxID=682080 RepID=A0A9P4QNN4_9PLEO|nr:YjgF-like protein [Polyplosphaeria fusca]
MSSNKPHAWNPPGVPQPPATYDQVCVTPLLPAAKLITLAGQTGRNLESLTSISSDFATQVRGAYKRVLDCLKATGATPRDIVHVKHYIVTHTGQKELDGKDIVDRGWGDLWCEFMDKEGEGHRPPDTVVGVASLAKGGYLYEVEVMAVVNE